MKRKAKDRERREESDRRAAAPMLPISRPRSLTIGGQDVCPDLPITQRTHYQGQSPFFRLPLELRLAIYDQVFDYRGVHLVPIYAKLGCRVCHHETHGTHEVDCISVARLYSWPGSSGFIGQMDNTLPLLKTCRRVYSEAIDRLYVRRTFYVQSFEAILTLAISVLPRRFHAITRLELYQKCLSSNFAIVEHTTEYVSSFRKRVYGEATQVPASFNEIIPGNTPTVWEVACEAIASMSGLTHLQIGLYSCHPSESTRGEETIFRPLRKISRPQNFEVHVNWEESENFQKEPAPFKLTRLNKRR